MTIFTRGVARARPHHFSLLSRSCTRYYANFTYSPPTTFTFATQQKDGDALLSQLKKNIEFSNPSSHDAVVVLGTPGLAKLMANDSFVGNLSNSLLSPASGQDTHVVSAVVEKLAPANSANIEEGISVLRGRLDEILPGIWNPQAPRSREDADTVSVLTFGLNDGSVTLPLARTVFQNQRISTLIATRFQGSEATPSVAYQAEPKSSHINLPTNISMTNTSLWLPLIPLTHSRKVLESFGNIVRGIDVDGKRTPASTELEEIVDKMYSLENYTQEVGPMGVWALVTPESSDPAPSQLAEPNPDEMYQLLSSGKGLEQLASKSSDFVAQYHHRGARLYKLLSGGGGWGQKKGLLSLDPQRSHFAASEEEDMERFLNYSKGNDQFGFVPPGSRIQFFAADPLSPATKPDKKLSYIFGVYGEARPVTSELKQDRLWMGQFGAMSSSGIYVKDHGKPLAAPDSRITVPGSQLTISSP